MGTIRQTGEGTYLLLKLRLCRSNTQGSNFSSDTLLNTPRENLTLQILELKVQWLGVMITDKLAVLDTVQQLIKQYLVHNRHVKIFLWTKKNLV